MKLQLYKFLQWGVSKFKFTFLILLSLFVATQTAVAQNSENHILKIQSAEMVENIWDNVFFISLSEPLFTGTEFSFSMDVKADIACLVYSQEHSQPCDFRYMPFVDNISITTDWKTYTYSGTVPSDGQTMAFLLSTISDANTFYFDNISFVVDGKELVVNGNIEGEDLSAFINVYNQGSPTLVTSDNVITQDAITVTNLNLFGVSSEMYYSEGPSGSFVVTYADGSTNELPISYATYNLEDTPGNQEVTFNFHNCTATKTITIKPNEIDLSGVSETQMQNEALSGTVKFDNGDGTFTEYDISEVVEHYDPSTVGTQKLIVRIGDYYNTKTITVKENTKKFYGILDEANLTVTFGYGAELPSGAVALNPKRNVESSLIDELTSTPNTIKKIEFDKSVSDFRPTSMSWWFDDCRGVTVINGLEYLDTEYVIYINNMFEGCSLLTTLDLSNFNTKNVTNMRQMFSLCFNLETIFVGDYWSTDNVTDGGQMFIGCDVLFGGEGTQCNINNEVAYAHIDGGIENPGYLTKSGTTKNVTIEFTKMQTEYVIGEQLNFVDAVLSVTFNGRDPVEFNGNGPEFSEYDNTKIGKQTLTATFQGTTTTIEVSVTDGKGAYSEFDSKTGVLTLQYCQYRDGLRHISNGLCDNTDDVTKVVIDPSFAEFKPISCESWFYEMHNLAEIDGIEYLNTNNVTSLSGMFYQCQSLTTLDLSHFNTSKVTKMALMFNSCENLTTIYVGEGWNTDAVISAESMFCNCKKLIGGNGTECVFDYSYSDNYYLPYARVDDPENGKPGYFTYKGPNPYTEPEVVDNVYQISSASELLYFMFYVNNGNVSANAVLLNDIVVNADLLKQIAELLKSTSKAAPVLTTWQPIGTTKNAYRGTFDGNGHTISGIYIKDETQNNVGLFGNVSKDAVIKNLGVTDSYIAGNENVGAICGKSEGTVVNCYTISEVKGSKNVNALVGAKETAAVIENCYYLAETPIANDPCAKTAEDFKSGNVAKLLAKGATINNVTYSGESFEGLTQLPGTEDIEVIPEPEPEPENPPSPVSDLLSNSNIKVWSSNSTIYIASAPDTKYTIIDLNGRTIKSATTKSTKEEININKTGVLIVLIGNTAYKVAN